MTIKNQSPCQTADFYTPPARRCTNLSVRYLLYTFVFISLITATISCKDSFQALEDNDQYYFSIYGYLDAAVDTQWVRISPAREQIETPADIPDMSVTLENLDTGKIITMNDSLFQINGANYLNFWTTESIENSQRYKLVAERPTGEKSQVTVDIPDEIPVPIVIIQKFFGQPTTYQVIVSDDVYVADVQTKWYVRIHYPGEVVSKVFTFAHRNTASHTDSYGGAYTYHLSPDEELDEIEKKLVFSAEGEVEVIHRQIFVASAGSEWMPEVSSLDDITYSLLETFSNVEKGVGFLTGIDSKYIPFKSCLTEDEVTNIPCAEEEAFW